MTRRWLTALLLATLAAGCSGNGGSTGTGISQLTGNVSSLDSANLEESRPVHRLAWWDRLGRSVGLAAIAHAQASLEGIRVEIREFGFETRTDSGGSFQLTGTFGGSLTVSFERADDGVAAVLEVRMPRGASLALDDVRIENDRAVPAARRLEFESLLVDRDCPGNALFVASRFDPDGPIFEIRLDTSSIRDRRGRPFDCENLGRGDRLDVRGFLEDDGRVGGADVELPEQAEGQSPDDGGPPSETPTPVGP